MNILLEAVGITGGMFVLVAFIYASTGRWNGESFWYEFNNFLGAILLFIYTLQKDAYTNILLNIIWGSVAFWALLKIVSRRRKRVMGKPVR